MTGVADLGGRSVGDGGAPLGSALDALGLTVTPENVLEVRKVLLAEADRLWRGLDVEGRRCRVSRVSPRLISASDSASSSATLPRAKAASSAAAEPRPRCIHSRPVTLPVEVLDAALAARPRTASAFADELVRQGVASVDATAVAHMSRGVLARGQFGATGRRPGLTGPPGSVPPGATGRRGPWVIGYHRAANGWFLQLRRAGTVTLAPLDTARLRARVAELIGVVRADQRERSARISSA